MERLIEKLAQVIKVKNKGKLIFMRKDSEEILEVLAKELEKLR